MRFKQLTLNTKNLAKITAFYNTTLNLPITSSTDSHVTFSIGKSALTFMYHPNATPYHIAINIPCNQELEGLNWLKKRVAILPHFNNEIIDFKNWNAKAIYFHDSDNNVVEFIARKNLKNYAISPFGSSSLLEISEIGLPVKNIARIFQFLNLNYNQQIYFGDFNAFCAIGDEHGLFIVINEHKKNWFPTNDIAITSDFNTTIAINHTLHHLEFINGALKAVKPLK